MYYSVLFIKGFRVARLVLEVFSWITLLSSVPFMLQINLKRMELSHIEGYEQHLPIWAIALGWGYIILLAMMIYALRSRRVIEYAASDDNAEVDT